MRHSRRGEHRGRRQDTHAYGGRGRRRRILDGGQLRILLLSLIAEQERHGYDLIREIEARSGGAYAPSPGVIYPTLTLLLDMGLVEEGNTEGSRKLFALTEAGRTFLDENASDAETTMNRIESLAERQEQLDPAPVRRAMENLKSAIRNRLSEDGIDKEIIFSVAGLVDEAASRIERL